MRGESQRRPSSCGGTDARSTHGHQRQSLQHRQSAGNDGRGTQEASKTKIHASSQHRCLHGSKPPGEPSDAAAVSSGSGSRSGSSSGSCLEYQWLAAWNLITHSGGASAQLHCHQSG